VRSLPTRASITATSFVNEYHWGNFPGDPGRVIERYYDAHLYLTNWGTHRIMLRMPRDLLDIDVAKGVGDQVAVWTTGKFLVLDMTSEDDSGDWEPRQRPARHRSPNKSATRRYRCRFRPSSPPGWHTCLMPRRTGSYCGSSKITL
jgi:hypothetical protein